MSLWLPKSRFYAIGDDSVLESQSSACAGVARRSWGGGGSDSERGARLTESLKNFTTPVRARALKGRPQVAVAEYWSRYWVMQSPEGLDSLAGLKAVAMARCQQLLGQDTAWEVIGDWHACRPFMCVALPLWLTTAVRTALGQSVSINTPLLSLLRRMPKSICKSSSGWACVSSTRRLQILSWNRARLSEIRSLAIEEDDNEELRMQRAVQEIRRMQLRGVLPDVDTGIWWSWTTPTSESVSVVSGWRFTGATQYAHHSTPYMGMDLEPEAVCALHALQLLSH